MIWLTWRQHRRSLLWTLIGLAGLAAVMLPTGLAMHRDWDRLGLARCIRSTPEGLRPVSGNTTCDTNWHQFSDTYYAYQAIGILFVFLPLVVGLFWGASLVARETEHGTHRFVWTQTVSRTRWALTKFGLVGGTVLALSGLYAAGLSWWFGPLDAIGNARFMYLTYDVQGIVPVAYTLFAVALGILAGTLLRRVGPAMGITLAAYLVVRIGLTALARPNFRPGKVFTYPVDGGVYDSLPLGDWGYYAAVKDAGGRVIRAGTEASCPPGACQEWPAGAYNWILYQPASRYWTFQWLETGIYLALVAALVLVALRRIPRVV